MFAPGPVRTRKIGHCFSGEEPGSEMDARRGTRVSLFSRYGSHVTERAGEGARSVERASEGPRRLPGGVSARRQTARNALNMLHSSFHTSAPAQRHDGPPCGAGAMQQRVGVAVAVWEGRVARSVAARRQHSRGPGAATGSEDPEPRQRAATSREEGPGRKEEETGKLEK
eukprot:1959174-Rhodomonas_salina.2